MIRDLLRAAVLLALVLALHASWQNAVGDAPYWPVWGWAFVTGGLYGLLEVAKRAAGEGEDTTPDSEFVDSNTTIDRRP